MKKYLYFLILSIGQMNGCLFSSDISTCDSDVSLIASYSTKTPTEPEISDLLRQMTMEAFDSLSPPPNGGWKIEEKSFEALDYSGKASSFLTLEETQRRLRTIIPGDIQNITYGQIKFYLEKYADFSTSEVPLCITSTAVMKLLSEQGTPLPFARVILYWQVPNKKNSFWVLKRVQLFRL